MATPSADRLAHGLSAACAALCLAALLGVLGAFSLETLTSPGADSLPASPGAALWPYWGATAMTAGLGAAIAGVAGVGTAAWLVYSASEGARRWAMGGLELLAGLPAVALGLVGVMLLAPALPQGELGGLHALNASLLLAVMVFPTVTALSAHALAAVPPEQVRASLALGADRWQTVTRVALPSAWPGVAAGLTLGLGRAMGETMLLLMLFDSGGDAPFGGLLGGAETVTVVLAQGFSIAADAGARPAGLLALVGMLFGGTFLVNLSAELLRRRAGVMA